MRQKQNKVMREKQPVCHMAWLLRTFTESYTCKQQTWFHMNMSYHWCGSVTRERCQCACLERRVLCDPKSSATAWNQGIQWYKEEKQTLRNLEVSTKTFERKVTLRSCLWWRRQGSVTCSDSQLFFFLLLCSISHCIVHSESLMQCSMIQLLKLCYIIWGHLRGSGG